MNKAICVCVLGTRPEVIKTAPAIADLNQSNWAQPIVVSTGQHAELLDRAMAAMQASWIVVTDSGGLQDDTLALGKPVLVLRDITEQPEAIASGAVELAGTNGARILQAIQRLYTDASAYKRLAQAVFPYGDGKAAERIAEAMRQRTCVADG